MPHRIRQRSASSRPAPRHDGADGTAPSTTGGGSATAGSEKSARWPVRSARSTAEESTYGSSRSPTNLACRGSCSRTNPSARRTTVNSARIRPVGESSSERRASPGSDAPTSADTRSFSHARAAGPETSSFHQGERSTNAAAIGAMLSGSAIACQDSRVVETPRVLVVTNDFPPRVGGAQQYIWNLVAHLRPDRVSVLAPNHPGWREHDAAQAFPVHRWPAGALWPTPAVARRTVSLAREHRADVVLFGHGLLPIVGGALAARGLPYAVITHGWEVWLARTPGVATAMRRGLEGAAEVASVSRYTGREIRGALGLSRSPTVLYPGVDEERFAPSVDGSGLRDRFGLGDRPVVVCVSRLVRRKGQDTLIRAVADARRLVPDITLLLVGDG